MSNKIKIEVDLDSILTAKDKTDAIYKCIKEEVCDSQAIKDLRHSYLKTLISDDTVETTKKKIKEAFIAEYNTEEIKQVLAAERYKLRDMVFSIIRDNKELIIPVVLKELQSQEFVQDIVTLVKQGVENRIIDTLNIAPDRSSED